MVHSEGDRPAREVVNLRDWFAGQALMGAFTGRTNWPTNEETWHAFAWCCYGLADEMVKERKRHHTKHLPKQHSHA